MDFITECHSIKLQLAIVDDLIKDILAKTKTIPDNDETAHHALNDRLADCLNHRLALRDLVKQLDDMTVIIKVTQHEINRIGPQEATTPQDAPKARPVPNQEPVTEDTTTEGAHEATIQAYRDRKTKEVYEGIEWMVNNPGPSAATKMQLISAAIRYHKEEHDRAPSIHIRLPSTNEPVTDDTDNEPVTDDTDTDTTNPSDDEDDMAKNLLSDEAYKRHRAKYPATRYRFSCDQCRQTHTRPGGCIHDPNIASTFFAGHTNHTDQPGNPERPAKKAKA